MATAGPRLADYDDQGLVDIDTGLFSSKFFKSIIAKQVMSFERYQAFFSVVLVTIPEHALKKSSVDMKTIASFIKSNIRVVDEVGTSGHGQFCILLPHTIAAGASVVAERIRTGLGQLADLEGISVDFFSVPESLNEIMALADLVS